MVELLFGAGIAMLIAILAWSDQINSLHKDTLEAESLMTTKRNVDWKSIKLVLRNISDPNEALTKLTNIFDKSSSKSFENINIIYKFRSLDSQSRRLKIYFQIKYYLIIFLTLSFFVGGIIAFFTSDSKYICIFNSKVFHSNLPAMFCIIVSFLVLIFIIFLNYKEFTYRNNFIDLIDQI